MKTQIDFISDPLIGERLSFGLNLATKMAQPHGLEVVATQEVGAKRRKPQKINRVEQHQQVLLLPCCSSLATSASSPLSISAMALSHL